MVFFSDVSGLLTSDGADMGMVGGWVKVISGEVSNGTVISGESPPMNRRVETIRALHKPTGFSLVISPFWSGG